MMLLPIPEDEDGAERYAESCYPNPPNIGSTHTDCGALRMRTAVLRWGLLVMASVVCALLPPGLLLAQDDADDTADFPLVVTFESNRRSVIAFDQIWWTVQLHNPTEHAIGPLVVEMTVDERLTHYRMRRLSNGRVVVQPPRFAAEAVRVAPGATVTVQFDVEVRGSADTGRLHPFTHQARIIYPDGRVQTTQPISVRLDRIPRTELRWWWGLALVGVGLGVARLWQRARP